MSPLPYDVLECIFLHTAASSREATTTLCLVASRARNIAIPHVFNTVMVDSWTQMNSLLKNRRLANPPAVYGSATAHAVTVPLAHHVRHLYINCLGVDVLSVLQLCPQLQSVALLATHLGVFDNLPLFPCLRRLTVLTSGFGRSLDPMEWHNFGRAVPSPTSTSAPSHHRSTPCPSVSALCRCSPTSRSKRTTIVRRCPNLRMLVITLVSDSKTALFRATAIAFCAHDARMYACPVAPMALAGRGPFLAPLEFGQEWRHDVDTGEDVWARAAHFRTLLNKKQPLRTLSIS
jgi:hypothetical protein